MRTRHIILVSLWLMLRLRLEGVSRLRYNHTNNVCSSPCSRLLWGAPGMRPSRLRLRLRLGLRLGLGLGLGLRLRLRVRDEYVG